MQRIQIQRTINASNIGAIAVGRKKMSLTQLKQSSSAGQMIEKKRPSHSRNNHSPRAHVCTRGQRGAEKRRERHGRTTQRRRRKNTPDEKKPGNRVSVIPFFSRSLARASSPRGVFSAPRESEYYRPRAVSDQSRASLLYPSLSLLIYPKRRNREWIRMSRNRAFVRPLSRTHCALERSQSSPGNIYVYLYIPAGESKSERKTEGERERERMRARAFCSVRMLERRVVWIAATGADCVGAHEREHEDVRRGTRRERAREKRNTVTVATEVSRRLCLTHSHERGASSRSSRGRARVRESRRRETDFAWVAPRPVDHRGICSSIKLITIALELFDLSSRARTFFWGGSSARSRYSSHFPCLHNRDSSSAPFLMIPPLWLVHIHIYIHTCRRSLYDIYIVGIFLSTYTFCL